MTLSVLSFTPEILSKIFPFYIIFNCDREIIDAGAAIQRVSPPDLLHSLFEQHFSIQRPKITCEIESIKKNQKSLFLLQSHHNEMQLKGQMLYLEDAAIVLFVGSPWVTDTKSLAPLGLKLKDFAIHDPIVDFLFLLQSKDTALADSQKLAEELTQRQIQLQRTQMQLIQTEKMSSLGQLVAGIAHEINNPVNFIHANLPYIRTYGEDLLNLIQLVRQSYAQLTPELETVIADLDLEFVAADLHKILNSMKSGTDRIRSIVLSLRNFSRLDESECKAVNLHEGIDSTLLMLQHRLQATADRPTIQVQQSYSDLPLVECYAGQLNQVLMHLLSNAIDALEESNISRSFTEIEQHLNTIWIHTETIDADNVRITIADNGIGIPEEVRSRIFDPFFTTKPVGKGTGIGLSVCYQIITEQHHGKLYCDSTEGEGTKFAIEIPTKHR